MMSNSLNHWRPEGLSILLWGLPAIKYLLGVGSAQSTIILQFFCSHASTGTCSRDICNHEECVCDIHVLMGDPDEICVVLNDAKVEAIWLNDGK